MDATDSAIASSETIVDEPGCSKLNAKENRKDLKNATSAIQRTKDSNVGRKRRFQPIQRDKFQPSCESEKDDESDFDFKILFKRFRESGSPGTGNYLLTKIVTVSC